MEEISWPNAVKTSRVTMSRDNVIFKIKLYKIMMEKAINKVFSWCEITSVDNC